MLLLRVAVLVVADEVEIVVHMALWLTVVVHQVICHL